MTPQLLIVVDTEEEFDWSAPFSRDSRATTSIPAQARAHEIYDRFGIVPTYVIDHPVATDPAAVAFLKGLRDAGKAEIGAHLHPWVTPPHVEEVTTRNSYHCNLPPALERAKVVLDAERRKNIIETEARDLAFAQGLELVDDPALLEEVAGLVEWPVLLMGSFDPAFLDIHVWARGPVGEATRNEPDTALELDFGGDGAVFVTKRYQVFTDMIPRLIGKGVAFVEIGGNDEIMLTVLSDHAVAPPEGSRQLFSYPLPASPQTRRTGLMVAVRKLDSVLPLLGKAGAKLEHVYDY